MRPAASPMPPPRRRRGALLAGAALSLAVAGCGGDGAEKGAAATSAKVDIASYKFVPPKLTVGAGAKVTFVNRDKAPHTATAEDKSFDTGTLRATDTRTVTLRKPGTYRYYCDFHRFMEADVVVEQGD